MLEIKTDENVAGARIIVAGIGGAGGNAIDRMVEEKVYIFPLEFSPRDEL